MQSKGLSRVFSNTTVQKINSSVISFLYVPTLTSKRKKCKRVKWLSEEALHIAVYRREVKGKGQERYTHLNAEFQRIARRDKKPSSVISAKK